MGTCHLHIPVAEHQPLPGTPQLFLEALFWSRVLSGTHSVGRGPSVFPGHLVALPRRSVEHPHVTLVSGSLTTRRESWTSGQNAAGKRALPVTCCRGLPVSSHTGVLDIGQWIRDEAGSPHKVTIRPFPTHHLQPPQGRGAPEGRCIEEQGTQVRTTGERHSTGGCLQAARGPASSPGSLQLREQQTAEGVWCRAPASPLLDVCLWGAL